jgi:ATP phosphoribosyltransferase
MPLRLGLPKGSLQEATFRLFDAAGFTIHADSRSYHPSIDDSEIEPILLRPQEIPRYIGDGIIDAGLSGQDWVRDSGMELVEVCELEYSKATDRPIRIVLAVAEDSPFQKPEDLEGATIATEYVATTQRWFAERGVRVNAEFSWGACEVKVPHLVPAIVVNTETGNSLRANRLRILAELALSRTVLVSSERAWADEGKRAKLKDLRVLLTGALRARRMVGLKMNMDLEARSAVLAELKGQGMKNPTLNELAEGAGFAAEVVLGEKESRALIPRLLAAGATGIVEYPLNKVVG